MKKTAIYPGSFDPPTNGHIDVIERALTIFDEIIILVIINPVKATLFSVEERMEILKNLYGNKYFQRFFVSIFFSINTINAYISFWCSWFSYLANPYNFRITFCIHWLSSTE